jgi:hypothetical protein
LFFDELLMRFLVGRAMYAETQEEKDSWIRGIQKAIEDLKENKKTLRIGPFSLLPPMLFFFFRFFAHENLIILAAFSPPNFFFFL